MRKYLMNSDMPVLVYDLEDMYVEVLNNRFLPYALRDCIETTNALNFKKSMQDIDRLKDFFSSRVLNLSRENAKVILNVASLPQSLKTNERLKIVDACRGLSMTDNFWIRNERENLKFSDVNLRENKLCDASFYIAILGQHISATAKELSADISAQGMFPKFWERRNDGVYMLKTDKYRNHESVHAEILSCKLLESLGINCVHYEKETREGQVFAVSKCMTNDNYSIVSAQGVKDWLTYHNIDLLEYVNKSFRKQFANMCVMDYVLGNTDRHFENWDFVVDNNTNEITGLAPLYDFNQALLIDWLGKGNLDELIYEPTGKSFKESVKEYISLCDINFNKTDKDIELPERCKNRIEHVKQYQRMRMAFQQNLGKTIKEAADNTKKE